MRTIKRRLEELNLPSKKIYKYRFSCPICYTTVRLKNLHNLTEIRCNHCNSTYEVPPSLNLGVNEGIPAKDIDGVHNLYIFKIENSLQKKAESSERKSNVYDREAARFQDKMNYSIRKSKILKYISMCYTLARLLEVADALSLPIEVIDDEYQRLESIIERVESSMRHFVAE